MKSLIFVYLYNHYIYTFTHLMHIYIYIHMQQKWKGPFTWQNCFGPFFLVRSVPVASHLGGATRPNAESQRCRQRLDQSWRWEHQGWKSQTFMRVCVWWNGMKCVNIVYVYIYICIYVCVCVCVCVLYMYILCTYLTYLVWHTYMYIHVNAYTSSYSYPRGWVPQKSNGELGRWIQFPIGRLTPFGSFDKIRDRLPLEFKKECWTSRLQLPVPHAPSISPQSMLPLSQNGLSMWEVHPRQS